MTKPLFILLLIVFCGCSSRAILFEDLPSSCIDCKVEIKKYNSIGCIKDSINPINNPNVFITKLKELNFYPIENPNIGVTNDMDIVISKKDSTILNLSIWIENGFAYIYKNGNYYYSICESLEFLFK